MQSSTAAQQIVAELLQYAACLGERGEGGDLEVGQGFQETELLSCLGSPPLNNYLSLRAHTHTLKTPTVAKSYLRRVHML